MSYINEKYNLIDKADDKKLACFNIIWGTFTTTRLDIKSHNMYCDLSRNFYISHSIKIEGYLHDDNALYVEIQK